MVTQGWFYNKGKLYEYRRLYGGSLSPWQRLVLAMWHWRYGIMKW